MSNEMVSPYCHGGSIILLTQVVEVKNFSCLLRKSRIGTEPHEKIVSLQCFETHPSQYLNKVIRENSCVYFLFGCNNDRLFLVY